MAWFQILDVAIIMIIPTKSAVLLIMRKLFAWYVKDHFLHLRLLLNMKIFLNCINATLSGQTHDPINTLLSPFRLIIVALPFSKFSCNVSSFVVQVTIFEQEVFDKFLILLSLKSTAWFFLLLIDNAYQLDEQFLVKKHKQFGFIPSLFSKITKIGCCFIILTLLVKFY